MKYSNIIVFAFVTVLCLTSCGVRDNDHGNNVEDMVQKLVYYACSAVELRKEMHKELKENPEKAEEIKIKYIGKLERSIRMANEETAEFDRIFLEEGKNLPDEELDKYGKMINEAYKSCIEDSGIKDLFQSDSSNLYDVLQIDPVIENDSDNMDHHTKKPIIMLCEWVEMDKKMNREMKENPEKAEEIQEKYKLEFKYLRKDIDEMMEKMDDLSEEEQEKYTKMLDEGFYECAGEKYYSLLPSFRKH